MAAIGNAKHKNLRNLQDDSMSVLLEEFPSAWLSLDCPTGVATTAFEFEQITSSKLIKRFLQSDLSFP